MKLISHRGNINGKSLDENNPELIVKTLSNFDVEIDLWVDKGIFLGHDFPEYKIDLDFLKQKKLWIHCKNIKALKLCRENKIINNYFYHQNDDTVLTSNGYFWTYPGKELTEYSIAVLPEYITYSNVEIAYGICSDYIKNYKF